MCEACAAHALCVPHALCSKLELSIFLTLINTPPISQKSVWGGRWIQNVFCCYFLATKIVAKMLPNNKEKIYSDNFSIKLFLMFLNTKVTLSQKVMLGPTIWEFYLFSVPKNGNLVISTFKLVCEQFQRSKNWNSSFFFLSFLDEGRKCIWIYSTTLTKKGIL